MEAIVNDRGLLRLASANFVRVDDDAVGEPMA
jgi:hypothetical protein